MGQGIYIGVDEAAKKVTGAYIGIGGVARRIKKVYVGINGVARLAYAESSGPVGNTVTVTIKNSGDADNCYVTIGGMKYTDAATLSVSIGTTLEAYSTGTYRGTILLNDVSVSGGKPATYTMTVERDLTIEFDFTSTFFSGIYITEV